MIINKIEPQGYCGGVKKALNDVYKAIDDPNTPKPIYLLGAIIHNEHVINDLISKGVILVEDKKKRRVDLIQQIHSGTIVFSAHGVCPEVYKIAKEKKLHILDTTCKNVLIVHERIKKHLDLGYTCFYIGTKSHPEAEGVLGISNKIILINSISDLEQINVTTPVYVTNQTTLSIYQTNLIYEYIQNNFKNAIIDNKICNATTIRQKAILEQNPVDLSLVIGDKTSSNTNKLVEASKSIGIKTFLIEDKSQINEIDLTNVNTISISSGASTPSYIVDEVIEILEKK